MPATEWEISQGADVPQTGPTLFAAEARQKAYGLSDKLRDPKSWSNVEPMTEALEGVLGKLPSELGGAPWKGSPEGYLWRWLDCAGLSADPGISLPCFGFVVDKETGTAIHVLPEVQVELEDFARTILTLGSYTARSLMEAVPQGFERTGAGKETRHVSGRESLAGLAKMADKQPQDVDRATVLSAAIRIRDRHYIEARRAATNDGKPFWQARCDFEVGFDELVEAATGEDAKILAVTNKSRLETIRRYAKQFVAAGALKIPGARSAGAGAPNRR